MAGRSASSLVTSLLLVALGIVLGLAAMKGFELMHTEVVEVPPAPPPEMTHPHNLPRRKSFLEDVRFTGSFGSNGWKGAATYTAEHGSSVKLGTAVSAKGVEEIEAVVGYKSHDWQLAPDMELLATVKPGTPGVQYSAKVGKTLRGSLEPTLTGELSRSGLSVGALFNKALGKSVDLTMDLKVPISVAARKADLSVDAKTTYKVGNGKVVGTLTGKASGGLQGVKAGMTYDLGS
mmetsp:Transcript_147839/g.411724  ORF Transcript_147839/g.411724 Transcript_147839/m.411724 type:complete len:234 (-) Transcript_147839:112-813(-)